MGDMKKPKYNWLPDFVYGGIDGAVTTFAIVAGVVGAGLSTPIILIMGFANLIADGFSMAVGKYSSDKAELDRIRAIEADEQRSIEEKPKEEREEVKQILKQFGFSGANLRQAQRVITSNKDAWVHLMLHHEFHILEDNIQPKKGALATFVAFNLVGLVPLLGYLLQLIIPMNDSGVFMATCVATLVALFLVGVVKTRFTDQKWLWGGLETAAIGGIAAAIAYGLGALLGKLLGVG